MFYSILGLTSILGLLSACAPPATMPAASNGGNLSVEVRRLQASVSKQELSLQELSNQLAKLDEQLQQQADKIEQLRQAPQPRSQASDYQQPRTYQPLTAAPAQDLGATSPTEVYLQAFGDYASGRYQNAIHGFENFLQRFPNNSYASNAQFWLADCYFNQQQYPQAVQEFKRVLENYPSAVKSPETLYKIAVAQLQLGAPDQARLAVDTLTRNYPKSTAAQKAQDLIIP